MLNTDQIIFFMPLLLNEGLAAVSVSQTCILRYFLIVLLDEPPFFNCFQDVFNRLSS